LSPGTTYYFRAKAYSDATGWIYGNELSFTTLTLPTIEYGIAELSLPQVTTVSASDIGTTYATLNGETANFTATIRGFDWGKQSGNYTDSWTEEGSFPPGSFSHTISGLDPDTTYYFRAKAYSSETGWIYGDELSFHTTAVSTVGTSSVYHAVAYQKAKCFYALGYFRVFYVDSGYVKYASSSDGSTWGTPQNVMSVTYTYGQGLSVWTDGTYVYLAYAYLSNLRFVRGTLNADGTITWGSIVTVDSNTDCFHPSITLDSNGYPWIAYHRRTAYDLYVVKATATNGSTWGTPVLLRDLSNYSYQHLVPLANGKLYLLYSVYTVNNLIGVLYDGSSWGSDETVATGIWGYMTFQAVSNKNDKVYVVYDIPTGNIYVNERTTGWGTATLVTTRPENVYPTITWISPDDLFLFWVQTGTDHCYYVRRINGVWGSVVDWINESAATIYSVECPNSSFTVDGTYISCVYTTGSAAPYNVKFAFLTVAAAVTIVAKDFPMDYLPSPAKAEQLTSKVSGATITKVSQDYPEILIKSGKAQELRSKFST
jgi:hypothetical protein